MPTVTVDRLLATGVRVLTMAGVPDVTATQVVQSLLLSNLMGVDSHGVALIPNYVRAIDAGWIVPHATPEILSNNGVAALLDGRNGFGQIVARHAVGLAIQHATTHAIGAVAFTHVYHIGRLGEYASLAAEQGVIALIFANGSTPGGLVAPFGGRQRLMGTNPICFAVPAGVRPAMVADFSTSIVAEGRIRLARTKGERIPSGWVIDREGRPTTDPADLYHGGAILCFGDHKGFALSLLVEVLAGILSGANTPVSPDYARMQNGVFVLTIAPSFFRTVDAFVETVDRLFEAVEQVLPAEGREGVFLPGEPERRAKATRETEGIPIDDHTWAELQGLAAARIADCQ